MMADDEPRVPLRVQPDKKIKKFYTIFCHKNIYTYRYVINLNFFLIRNQFLTSQRDIK